jgi:hypothetical protein
MSNMASNPSETNATPANWKETSAKGLPPYQGYAGADRADSRLGGDIFDYNFRVRTAVVSYMHTAGDTGKRYLDRTPDLGPPLTGYDLPDDLGEIELIDCIVRPELAWGTAQGDSEDIELWYDDDEGGGATAVASINGVSDDLVADQANYMDLPNLGSTDSIIPAGSRLYIRLQTNNAGFTLGWVRVEVRYRLR